MGAFESYKYTMTSGPFNLQKNSHDYIAVIAFTQSAVKVWVVGEGGDRKIKALDSITVADGIINFYHNTVPMGAVVAHLAESEESASTLIVAYQETIVGTTITIRLKSYQIKGMTVISSYSQTHLPRIITRLFSLRSPHITEDVKGTSGSGCFVG